jgi:hypothetical protein
MPAQEMGGKQLAEKEKQNGNNIHYGVLKGSVF